LIKIANEPHADEANIFDAPRELGVIRQHRQMRVEGVSDRVGRRIWEVRQPCF
jgi:hypothetical protein